MLKLLEDADDEQDGDSKARVEFSALALMMRSLTQNFSRSSSGNDPPLGVEVPILFILTVWALLKLRCWYGSIFEPSSPLLIGCWFLLGRGKEV